MAENATTLRGISELRGFFRTNQTPVYFISPIAFNLLGIDRWVRRFYYVNYFDSFDGGHPCVFVPPRTPHAQFGSIEDVCNYLLGNPGLTELHAAPTGLMAKRCSCSSTRRPSAVPPASGSTSRFPRPSSATGSTRRSSRRSWARRRASRASRTCSAGRRVTTKLLVLASTSGLGDDLVVQTPYGDSGKTTFFVRGERDWNADAGEMADQELKVMRRIEPKAVAVEACITRHGTVIGPLMTDLTGHPELTPYRGGWCGNDIFPGALSAANRERALDFTRRLGDRLAQEGYRGQLEVDYLVDAVTDELYLGELNPRLSGISSMTNVSASAYADMPLFLFHLAEYLGVDYELDVDDLRRRWGSDHLTDVWGQIILKEPDDGIELLTDAPRTGIWRLGDDGQMTFSRPAVDWHGLGDESEGFYLRILGPGDYRYRGADLGILVTRTRLESPDGRLTDRCRAWIDGIRSRFVGAPLEPEAPPPIHDALAFKSG